MSDQHKYIYIYICRQENKLYIYICLHTLNQDGQKRRSHYCGTEGKKTKRRYIDCVMSEATMYSRGHATTFFEFVWRIRGGNNHEHKWLSIATRSVTWNSHTSRLTLAAGICFSRKYDSFVLWLHAFTHSMSFFARNVYRYVKSMFAYLSWMSPSDETSAHIIS